MCVCVSATVPRMYISKKKHERSGKQRRRAKATTTGGEREGGLRRSNKRTDPFYCWFQMLPPLTSLSAIPLHHRHPIWCPSVVVCVSYRIKPRPQTCPRAEKERTTREKETRYESAHGPTQRVGTENRRYCVPHGPSMML